MNKHRLLASASVVAALLILSAPSRAGAVTIDFSAVTDGVPIGNLYASKGVSFVNFNGSVVGPVSAADLAATPAYINIPGGFIGQVTFDVSSAPPIIFTVFPGVNGTGASDLAQLVLGSGTFGFETETISFDGVGESIEMDGSPGDAVARIDSLSFTSASDPSVPEPSTWAMMLLGFFGLGASLRSLRRPSFTAA